GTRAGRRPWPTRPAPHPRIHRPDCGPQGQRYRGLGAGGTTTRRPPGQRPGGRDCSAERRASGDRPHVLGLVALGTGGHLELDPLALLEAAVAAALDGRVVHEHVGTTLPGDEAVALLRVEPL